jgi:DnaJ-class molecular chaperone
MVKQQPAINGKTPTPGGSGTYPGDDAPPGTPGTGEAICPDCQGSGRVQGMPCRNCGGTGKITKGIAGG